MTTPRLPLRGEVWDAHPPRIGAHPVVILSINELRRRLSAVSVVLVTGTDGPRSTHVPLGPDAGLDRYDESYANVTDLHTIPLAACRRRRGLLSPAELETIGDAVRTVLGLNG